MPEMPVGPEPVLNNDPAPGAPDIAPPRSSPATVVAIVLSAMKNKRDPATYGTSYATVMNEDIAQKAARDIADIYAALQPSSAGSADQMDGGRPLPLGREDLGRMVREAWVRWAQTQPNPKPTWLVPYDELSEPDKEADRQIGEAVARWTLLADAARASLDPAQPSLPPSPHVEYVAARGQSKVTYWVSREEGDRIHAAALAPAKRPLCLCCEEQEVTNDGDECEHCRITYSVSSTTCGGAAK